MRGVRGELCGNGAFCVNSMPLEKWSENGGVARKQGVFLVEWRLERVAQNGFGKNAKADRRRAR
jgi:hypothetical protein